MKVEQSREELKKHLEEQFGFIQKSSREFDNGDISEARRIALHIRILLHDTKNSKSLLLTMGEKDRVSFLDSALIFNPKNPMPYMGLVSMKIVNDHNGFMAEYKPLLNDYAKFNTTNNNWKPFDKWWNNLIIKDQQGAIFSRKDLILHVADTDGGAHVGKLYENYVALSRNNSLGFTTVEKITGEIEQVNPIKNIELSSVRQIAFEVIFSLKQYFNFA